MISLHALLEEMTHKGASDLHITAGVPPQFRIDGQIIASDSEVVTPETAEKLAYSIMKEEQRKRFEINKELAELAGAEYAYSPVTCLFRVRERS